MSFAFKDFFKRVVIFIKGSVIPTALNNFFLSGWRVLLYITTQHIILELKETKFLILQMDIFSNFGV